MAVDQLLSTMAVATLSSGFLVVWEAIDPTTGAAVTGVEISNASAYGDVPELTAGPAPGGIDDTVPLYTPLQLEEQAVSVAA